MSVIPSSELGERSPVEVLPDFMEGGGEMGALMRRHAWDGTPLGPSRAWPLSLKTAVRIMLTSRQPIWIGWGSSLTFLYNDAYKSIIGGKHPWALGRPTKEVWREIWPDIAPLLAVAMNGDEGTYVEAQLLVMERNGYREETYYTFSYSPVPSDAGGTGGIICANTDDTRTVIGERQMALLRELAMAPAEARTALQACQRCARALARDLRDLPFAMIYVAAPHARSFSLMGSSGFPPGHPGAPAVIGGGSAGPWPIAEMLDETAAIRTIDLGDRRFPAGPWSESPRQAALIPVAMSGDSHPSVVIIAGLNPFRVFDDDYRRFLQLVAGEIGAGVANASAYEAERQRAEALAQIDRAKTSFFANVSHEFRTPLTLMLGPLQDVLASEVLPPGERELVDIAHRNSLRLLKLVNALLDFARVEAGRADASYAPVDLAAATRELASNFRSACERAGLALVVDCPPLPQPVYVDRDQWETIVLNLLSNAFKFTFEGAITVRLRATETHAILAVADTGVGIPAAELPRLFERFHRIEGQRGRTFEGSGIGLALVHSLVELHAGSIRAETGEGRGTTFFVSIPFGTAHLQSERIVMKPPTGAGPASAESYVQEALRWLPGAVNGQRAESSPAGRARPKVLLADDNADMRDYACSLLQQDCDLRSVANGQAALDALREEIPDLVIADVMMPVLDGFGLLRAIRAKPAWRDIPVIMLSARAGEESRLEGLAAGADGYLVKPFSARELLARVAVVLELASMRRLDRRKLESRRDILERVARGAPLAETLDALMLALEAHEPGMRCGILIVADDGKHFRRGSGPHLPEIYHRALDGVPIGKPWLGSCGEAADRCVAVKIPDVAAETRYAQQWRDLLLECGIHACRSTPVCGRDGRPLASIAMYYDQPRDPDPADHNVIDMATQLAAIAIEHDAVISALREQEKRQALLIHELNHRVKNTLAVVQALAFQTLRDVGDKEQARASLDARLVSLSAAHDLLTAESWEGGDLETVVRRALHAWRGKGGAARFNFCGEPLRLRPKALLALSMALHELATNAVKYGALSNEAGAVEICWDINRASGEFRFNWVEHGGPAVEPPARRGFGSRLIERGLAADVGGEVRLVFPATGVQFTLTAPLKEIEGHVAQT